MESLNNEITVSVCCITYNQEKYIAQAIEGFLLQKTDFKIEILIGEDYSTDNTRQIIQNYQSKHPDLIKILSGEKNAGGVKNLLNVLKNATGKYLAFCDGDDYWTDADKLQKQVDFLKDNQDFVACSHYSRVIDDKDETCYVAKNIVPLEYTFDDFLIGKKEETRTSSLVFRATDEFKNFGASQSVDKVIAIDNFLKLYITSTSGLKLYVWPKIMSCYRIHPGGIWSMIDPKIRKRKMINDFNILIDSFKYSSYQKKGLLKIYLRKYFLFQIRDFKIKNAYNTISQLL
ncbi:glycosyltransferase family 2 protein [Pedobacter ghigonis]|uniref:glycosyltransferase family 2 protein n=1 Tax=Pedobacter ghigonis TaxID=2730403 RepID=UPI00158A6710|nr:glycosyltransferase family 2 protein [Pedobacter ghigonis]